MENQTFLFVTKPDKVPQRVTVKKTQKWSCTRKTAKGDHALVYVNGKGISYEWIVVTKAERSPKGWKQPYCCKVRLVKNFDPPIYLSELQDAIPQKDWNAPHCNMRVKGATVIRAHVVEKVRALRKSFTSGPTPPANDAPDEVPEKIRLIVNRFIRDTKMTRIVKGKYKNRCQVCGKRMEIKPGVFYAEAHHIKPLGGEHKGPDVQDNILCLCPNHHALFDYFGIFLNPAKLRRNKHHLRQEFVEYHNMHFAMCQS